MNEKEEEEEEKEGVRNAGKKYDSMETRGETRSPARYTNETDSLPPHLPHLSRSPLLPLSSFRLAGRDAVRFDWLSFRSRGSRKTGRRGEGTRSKVRGAAAAAAEEGKERGEGEASEGREGGRGRGIEDEEASW